MNKQEYIASLNKALKDAHIPDMDEIVQEYEDHFMYKLSDGYSEEEIAARLEPPADIAAQYRALGEPTAKKAGKGVIITGLVFADFVVAIGFILLYSVVIVLGAFAIAVAALGFCLVAGMNIAALIPPMPYLAALGFGLSFLALGVLSAVGTIYAFLYVNRLLKVYARWHKNAIHGNILPPLSVQLSISGKTKRRLRKITLLSFAAFGLLSVITFAGLFIHTGFKEFWHELGWFQ